MRFHSYNWLFFGLILLLPVIQTCKKSDDTPKEEIIKIRRDVVVDHTADHKALAVVYIESADTTNTIEYRYLDTLVCVTHRTSGSSTPTLKSWYHLSGKSARLRIDSSFDQSGNCSKK